MSTHSPNCQNCRGKQHRPVLDVCCDHRFYSQRQTQNKERAVSEYLKVKDASIVALKGLSVWDDAVQEPVVQGERRDGGQEPAVACTQTAASD